MPLNQPVEAAYDLLTYKEKKEHQKDTRKGMDKGKAELGEINIGVHHLRT